MRSSTLRVMHVNPRGPYTFPPCQQLGCKLHHRPSATLPLFVFVKIPHRSSVTPSTDDRTWSAEEVTWKDEQCWSLSERIFGKTGESAKVLPFHILQDQLWLSSSDQCHHLAHLDNIAIRLSGQRNIPPNSKIRHKPELLSVPTSCPISLKPCFHTIWASGFASTWKRENFLEGSISVKICVHYHNAIKSKFKSMFSSHSPKSKSKFNLCSLSPGSATWLIFLLLSQVTLSG